MKCITTVSAPLWLMQWRFNRQCTASLLWRTRFEDCVAGRISQCINRHFSLRKTEKKQQTNTRETKALAEKGVNTKKREWYKDNKRNIIYTFNECACPKLLFLITFPCDIICCKIVYAWGTFSSCQLKSIWTNQYLSILWHTHSWPLGKSCLK